MKMYILIKDTVPTEFVPVVCAHASLACYLKYQEDEDMKQWIGGTFFKVICSVSQKEFDIAKSVERNVILTESRLNNEEVALAFCPRSEYPRGFKFYRKWCPNLTVL
jgi:hypothetical protein